MATPSRNKASAAHRRRRGARGLVRVEVLVTRADAGLIRAVAKVLRGDPARARALRSVLDQALVDLKVTSAFDVFGSDLGDEAFTGVFDAPRDGGWRALEL